MLARFDGPARADGLTWPDLDSKTRLVVAAATDGQLRAVVRRLVRRYAPPPSRRPADLAGNRTVPDLPPIAVLPLAPSPSDLAARLGLPRDRRPTSRRAVLGGTVRRLDLLRNDGGSVTLDGALLGGADRRGRPVPWRGRVEVDDAVLTDGDDPVLACAVGNADGLRDARRPAAADRAGPGRRRARRRGRGPGRRPGRCCAGKRVRVEVRRARGRAVAVTPRDGELPFLDDGVAGDADPQAVLVDRARRLGGVRRLRSCASPLPHRARPARRPRAVFHRRARPGRRTCRSTCARRARACSTCSRPTSRPGRRDADGRRVRGTYPRRGQPVLQADLRGHRQQRPAPELAGRDRRDRPARGHDGRRATTSARPPRACSTTWSDRAAPAGSPPCTTRAAAAVPARARPAADRAALRPPHPRGWLKIAAAVAEGRPAGQRVRGGRVAVAQELGAAGGLVGLADLVGGRDRAGAGSAGSRGWARATTAPGRAPSSRCGAAGRARGGSRCGRRRTRRPARRRRAPARPAPPTPRWTRGGRRRPRRTPRRSRPAAPTAARPRRPRLRAAGSPAVRAAGSASAHSTATSTHDRS